MVDDILVVGEYAVGELEHDPILLNRQSESDHALALCFGEHFNPMGDPVRSDNALVIPNVLPHILLRVQLAAFRRQLHDGDVGRCHHVLCDVPSGLRDGAEDIGRNRALIRWCNGTAAARCLAAGELGLLADPGLIAKQDIDLGEIEFFCFGDCRQRGRKFFSNPQWRRRPVHDDRRAQYFPKPSARSSLPDIWREQLTLDVAHTQCAKSAKRQRTTRLTAGSGPALTTLAGAERCSALVQTTRPVGMMGFGSGEKRSDEQAEENRGPVFWAAF